MKYFRKIIKHWPTIWLIIAIICFGSVISYSAYTRLSGIKRVVSTQKGSTALFSSNHLYPDRSDLEYIVCTNETNDVVIRFTVCNYAQNNQTKHYNGKLAYELKAQLTDKNGTPLSSNNIPASGIYTIQKTASEASEVCDLLPSGISKTFKGELYDGLLYCADCGAKVKQNGHGKNQRTGERNYFYTCGTYTRCGKVACSSHYISQKQIEKLLVADIRAKAKLVVEDEEKARLEFLKHKNSENARQFEENRLILKKNETRLAELKTLIHKVYEDKLLGKIPEEICIEMLDAYIAEQKTLTESIERLKSANEQAVKDNDDVEEFISRLKKYVDIQTVDRQICLELVEYIIIGEKPEHKGEPREVHIYYKFLDNELEDKRNLLLND